MAVTPTGAMYKSLIFDGEDSRNYGVYITGEAVFNAPERAVEMITIPGRNGEFALDQGRFENITVTYSAGIFADTEADFAQAVSDFRNLLCSKKGYCRLTDDYNPDEYRMAIYKSGLEIKPAQLKAGQFNITFECKPQRFLTSGETAVTVASGGTIVNPTLFEASPMLEVTGYGNIGIGNGTLVLDDVPLGEIRISEPTATAPNVLIPATLDFTNVLTGDAIYQNANGGAFETTFKCVSPDAYASISVTGTSGLKSVVVIRNNSSSVCVIITPTPFEGVAGTLKQDSVYADLSLSISGGAATACRLGLRRTYDGNNEFFVVQTDSGFPSGNILRFTTVGDISPFYAFSTVSVAKYYIDLDIGEAYGKAGDEIYSQNSSVKFPAKLPTLKPGANTINYDGTVTDLKIIPRWWKI